MSAGSRKNFSYDNDNNKMLRFKHLSTCLISGATQSGKTPFILRMLDAVCDDLIYEAPIERILYSYREHQAVFEKYKSFVRFHKGIPEPSNKIFDAKRPSLLILDDLMD